MKKNEIKFKDAVTVIFPPIRFKNGNPKKRQPPVHIIYGPDELLIKRGVFVEVPPWVPKVCRAIPVRRDRFENEYECFISNGREEK